MIKPIFYYSVMTPNRGDKAIRKSITDSILERIDVPFAYFNLKYDELTEERIVNQLNSEASCLMIAGSGLYSNANTSSGWYFPCKTELFDKIKVPIFLIGLGCNNNLKDDIFGELTEKAKKSIIKINKLASVSTVRDNKTWDLLTSMGIDNHALSLDPACHLKVKESDKDKEVAINMCQHAPSLGRFDCKIEGKKQREQNIYMFANACKYLKTLGYKLVFISHDALEHSLYEDLSEIVKDIRYVNTDNIDEMLGNYSRCSFTIGMKMHSCIMSFASGTPFIHPYYDSKSSEFLDMILKRNNGDSIFEINQEWFINKIDMMIDRLDEETFDIQTFKQIYKTSNNVMMDKICSKIKTTN